MVLGVPSFAGIPANPFPNDSDLTFRHRYEHIEKHHKLRTYVTEERTFSYKYLYIYNIIHTYTVIPIIHMYT